MKAQDVRVAAGGVLADLGALNRGIDDGIDGDGRSMASTLHLVERSIEVLKRTRTALLRHERQNGTSWGEIAQATGVPSSTWRNRYSREVSD